MISETVGMPLQEYCLRWNNHRENLLTVFDELLRNESFTDVTLVCEGGVSVKCHKMVLAACSSYFQCLFSDLDCSRPVVILKDIRYWEIKTILEYMYRGEVSIAQDQLDSLLKIAQALKVKGLVEVNPSTKSEEDSAAAISTSSTPTPFGQNSNRHRAYHRSGSGGSTPRSRERDTEHYEHSPEYTNNNSATSNANIESPPPPHSTRIIHQPYHKSPYYPKPPAPGPPPPPLPPMEKTHSRMNLHWPMSSSLSIGQQPLPSVFNNYESVIAATGNVDMPPFRKKKLSNFLSNKDTPILRTVLGQGQADSSQPMSLVCHPEGQDHHPTSQSNGPTTNQQELTFVKTIKHQDSSSEEVHSPHMETSFMEDDISQQERISKMMHASSSSPPQSFYSESKGGVSSGIATYVPTQKPEWKRYKQYTRNDIMSAIESVKNGMSALQAAKKYGVPSRTLYDKVKKLGISTQRPFRRSSGSSGHFPYNLGPPGSGIMFGLGGDDEPTSQALEHGFLQHALEMGNKMKLDTERNPLAPGVPPHGLLQHALEMGEKMKAAEMAESMTQGRDTSGTSSSPGPGDRSPSPPNVIKYAQHSSPIPPPEDDYEDQVEDLSMGRKPPETQPRIIMSPISQQSSAAIIACSVDNSRE